MRWWFCIPGALVPAAVARHAVQAMPREAQQSMRRATATYGPSVANQLAPHLNWLWQRFGGRGDPVLAPFLANDTTDDGLWCCDPVHFALALDHLVVRPIDATEDLRVLMPIAADVARASGVSLEPHGGQWFLRTSPRWQLDTTPLDAVLGRSLTDGWPTGADARRWRKLASDIQIEWHNHPVNERRMDRGLPEINGLWLHGGGERQQLAASAFASVVCDDPRVQAWARAAGMASDRVLGDQALPPSAGDAVSLVTSLVPAYNAGDWTTWLHIASELMAQWPTLLARATQAGFDLSLQLFGVDESRTIVLSPRDRWCFWRRTDIAALLTDHST